MTGETIMHIMGALSIGGLIFWAWKTTPAEDPEIIAARKEWGKIK